MGFNEWVCLITAAVVYVTAFILAGRIATRNLSTADQEAEDKGYFRKFDTPPSIPEPPRSGSDPPPAA